MTKHKEDRQADIELVKLALNMLSGGSGKNTTASRLFAIEMLQKYSGVTIDKAVADKWAEDGDIKFGSMAQALSNIGTDDIFNPPSVAEILRRQGTSPEEFRKMMGSSPLPDPDKN
ncbi:hypothetical protein AAIH70_11580 [Neorhizobium sp. BT27B]|uniref:hypothetical protein n=1 Tax=Neorhizobium sp. BT27B TaxID=3142625 RepID=UPI003D2A95BB